MIGRDLLHYHIEMPLGAGGMGEVYPARDKKLGRAVALKILPDVFARDPDRIARFEREAKLLALLNHTNIAARGRTLWGIILMSWFSERIRRSPTMRLSPAIENLTIQGAQESDKARFSSTVNFGGRISGSRLGLSRPPFE
jgi:serine/threonine protein kinase